VTPLAGGTAQPRPLLLQHLSEDSHPLADHELTQLLADDYSERPHHAPRRLGSASLLRFFLAFFFTALLSVITQPDLPIGGEKPPLKFRQS